MGELPMWYRLVRGAKYLGVAPWELEAQQITWLLAAEEAQAAEAAAQRAAQQGAQRKGASRAR